MDVRVTLIDPLLTIHKSAVISIFLHFVHGRYRTSRTWDWEWVGMVKWNSPFRSDRSNRKKRSTSKGGPLFQNFSGWTEPIHWVLDRNFRKFWLNGSCPTSSSSETQELQCTSVPAGTMRYFRAKVYFKGWRAPENLFLSNQFQKWSSFRKKIFNEVYLKFL